VVLVAPTITITIRPITVAVIAIRPTVKAIRPITVTVIAIRPVAIAIIAVVGLIGVVVELAAVNSFNGSIGFCQGWQAADSRCFGLPSDRAANEYHCCREGSD
jgi:hypothetical protein